MKINEILKKLIYFGYLPKQKVNAYQKIIRDNEWNAIESYIKENTKFLDVGCASGYAMMKASERRGCDVFGIDPEPNKFGVKFDNKNIKIIKANAEELPFDDKTFDVVYSSHVIEHVSDINQTLREISRVVKDNGRVIIIVPTSQSAWINMISSILFTSHLRVLRFVFRPITKSKRTRFKHVFFPYSHGKEDKTVFYDIRYYRVSNWSLLLKNHFLIKETLLPFFYPFPDYIQLFKAHKNKRYGSSVAFVCEKKN